jgi:hypothetical protein
MKEIYLATKNIIGYPGSGINKDIIVKKGDVLYCDDTTTFDQNSMEFKFYKNNKFVILNRKKNNKFNYSNYFNLPDGLMKLYTKKNFNNNQTM